MENTIKFLLEFGSTPRNGYINTTSSPAALESVSKEMGDDIEVVLSDFNKAHEIKSDQSVSEVTIGFYMNVMSLEQISNFLSNWTRRLVSGGIMKLKFIDTRQVCRGGAYGTLSLRDLHNMLLGPPGGEFKSLSDFETIKSSFDNSLCKIVYAKNDGYEIYVEIEKQDEDKN